ncbi:MAG: hypothetical protein IJD92_02715 [Bacilli bacterium]|nr:hypothetical protein [Bacilli bacterium]
MKFKVIKNENYKGSTVKKEKDINSLNKELYSLENKLQENIYSYNFIKNCRIFLYSFDILTIISLLCFNAPLFAILSLPILMTSSIELLLNRELGSSKKLKRNIERYTIRINNIKEIINSEYRKNNIENINLSNDKNCRKTNNKVKKLIKVFDPNKLD